MVGLQDLIPEQIAEIIIAGYTRKVSEHTLLAVYGAV